MKASICLLLVLLAMPAAQGAEFCATTSAELQAALTAAENNGQDDVIRIQTGTYSAPAGGFVFDARAGDNKDFSLSGGWTPFFGNPCGQQLSPSAYDTKLNGNGSSRVMLITPNPYATSVKVELLTFLGGNTEGLEYKVGAGLNVGKYVGDYAGDITIERNIFLSNVSGHDVGGLYAANSDGGSLLIRNNLFFANQASCKMGAAFIRSDDADTTYFINNTVVFNSVGDDCENQGSPPVGGLYRFGSSPAYMANNIFWGNENVDLKLDGDVVLVSNDYQNLVGTPATGSGMNYHVDPKFRFSTYTDVHLGNDSPLIDLGVVPPAEAAWQLSALDLDGMTRVVGSSVDLGAYENADAIFVDGFETP